jgi:hypothetical protein
MSLRLKFVGAAAKSYSLPRAVMGFDIRPEIRRRLMQGAEFSQLFFGAEGLGAQFIKGSTLCCEAGIPPWGLAK